MGESFLGFPNRFKITGSSTSRMDQILERPSLVPGTIIDLDTKFNPNHALSSYYGYKLATEYVNRYGGKEFTMLGPLYTGNIYPDPDFTKRPGFTGSAPSIGTNTNRYMEIFATKLHGTADDAEKLKRPVNLKITLKPSSNATLCYGTASFDGSEKETVEVIVNAPYLHLSLGGTVSGETTFNGRVHTREMLFTTTVIPYTTNVHPGEDGVKQSSYTIGNFYNRYLAVYAKEFKGSLVGNADTATNLENPVKITVDVSSEYANKGSSILWGYEGDGSNPETPALQGIVIKTAAKGYLPLTGGSITGDVYFNGVTHFRGTATDTLTGTRSKTHTVHNPPHKDYLAYTSDFGFALDIMHLQTYPYYGSYVSINKCGNPLNMEQLPEGTQYIDALIDDLATDNIIAMNGVKPNWPGGHSDINMHANALTVCQVKNSYHDDIEHISGYLHKNDNSDLRRGAIIGGSMVSNIICAGKSDENIIYPAEYDKWVTNPMLGNYTSKATLSNYCNNNKRYIDVYSRYVCFRSYLGSPYFDKSSSFSKLNDDGTYSGKDSHKMFGSSSPVFNAHRLGDDDLWTGVEIYSGYSSTTAHVYVAGKVKALGTESSSYQTLSDIRYKTDVSAIDRQQSINTITKVIPVSYIKDNKKEIGMVAQQVKESLLHDNKSIYYCDNDDECDYLTLNYPAFIPDLINTCQHLLNKVDNLEVFIGLKESLDFPELQKENKFDEEYYKKNAKKIADM